jgi:hypothetical protein
MEGFLKKIRIGTFNSLNTLHGLQWGEECTLNEVGQKWKADVLAGGEKAFADAVAAGKSKEDAGKVKQAYLGNAVKNAVRTGEGFDYHNWAQRSANQKEMLTAAGITVIGLQEVHHVPGLVPTPETVRECKASLNDILPNGMTVTNYAQFGLTLADEKDTDLSSKLVRGNAIIADLKAVTAVGQFTVDYQKKDDGKDQLRRVACSVFELGGGDATNPLRFAVCSHQTSGYDSRGPSFKGKDEARYNGFVDGYQKGNVQMEAYLNGIDEEMAKRRVDVSFFVGDTNQCAITKDKVDTVGLEDRTAIFQRHGYQEDANFKDSTTKFGRALDRIAWKVFPWSTYRVSKAKVSVIQPANGVDAMSLSDHRLVAGDFEFEKITSKM